MFLFRRVKKMSKTIAAVATGNSVSGIGVIRISGDNAIEIAEKVFKAMDSTPLSSLKGYTAKFGNVYSKVKNLIMPLHLYFVRRKVIQVKMLLNFRFTAVYLLLKKLWRLFLPRVHPLPKQVNLQSVHF